MNKAECPICSSNTLQIKYQGDIRNGKYPNVVQDACIYSCNNCSVEFLSDYKMDYDSPAYRELVDSDHTADAYYSIHDKDQYVKLSFIDLSKLRGKRLIDIGCGAGSFLDLVKGYTSETYAVEPAKFYHDVLASKGHKVYDSVDDIVPELENTFDYVVSFSVIEHVEDPLKFMEQAVKLLKNGGQMIFSTPNAEDILLKLLPREYTAFFYRVVHKWYFNKNSLTFISKKTGLKSFEIVYMHRFGLSNLLTWMDEKKPNSSKKINFSDSLNSSYKFELEEKGIADYIYLIATK
jgi:2-polyprenyl-3-methyl-5-hydroxy-6-metoxy-1,4-benzoquinol methylase